MIAILDTNILISALLVPRSLPARLVDEWTEQRFDLVTSEEQIAEFRRVSRYPRVAENISAPRAGHLIRQIRKNGTVLGDLPRVDHCRDPNDNYLLAMAQVSNAEFLVTGDKSDLLIMDQHRSTKIVTVRHFAERLKF
jgi:putative PIN family toxin of toxin-antitoxin system